MHQSFNRTLPAALGTAPTNRQDARLAAGLIDDWSTVLLVADGPTMATYVAKVDKPVSILGTIYQTGLFKIQRIRQPPGVPTKVLQGGSQMPRHGLTDQEFYAIRHLLPKQKFGKPGRRWIDHRSVIDGILWIAKTGSPWRDLPEQLGK